MVLLISGTMARVLKILCDCVCLLLLAEGDRKEWGYVLVTCSHGPNYHRHQVTSLSPSLSLFSSVAFQLNGSRHECNEEGYQYFVVGLQLSVLIEQIANAVILARELGATLVMPTIRESLKEPGRYAFLLPRLIFSCR